MAAARQQVEAKGVAFEGPVHDIGVCHMTFFHDPEGNLPMLHRRCEPEVGGADDSRG